MTHPAARPPRVCSECGSIDDNADLFCVMSDDGEGPHRWSSREPKLPAKHLTFLQHVSEHIEQGAQER